MCKRRRRPWQVDDDDDDVDEKNASRRFSRSPLSFDRVIFNHDV